MPLKNAPCDQTLKDLEGVEQDEMWYLLFLTPCKVHTYRLHT